MARNREKQRANRKRGKDQAQTVFRNAEGYPDPTPYFAMKKIDEKTGKEGTAK